MVGKGGKMRLVACPAPLVHRLKAFAFYRARFWMLVVNLMVL